MYKIENPSAPIPDSAKNTTYRVVLSAIVDGSPTVGGLAGFTTFATILGRYNLNNVMDGCCSVLGCEETSFKNNLKSSFRNFVEGVRRMPKIYQKSYFRQIIKTSLYVMITAESVCILTAETVNLIFFRHALWLSIPLSLLAGAFAITAIEAYKKIKTSSV